jgi:hypothetical protein
MLTPTHALDPASVEHKALVVLVGASQPGAAVLADWEREAPTGDVRVAHDPNGLRALLEGLDADQPVVVAEAATTPGPDLVARLLDARPHADVVDARVLPVDLSHAPEPDMDAELAAVRVGRVGPRVSGSCVLTTAATAAKVAEILGGPRDGDTGRGLRTALESAGHGIEVAVLATVVRHADLSGHREAGAATGGPPEPPRTTHPALLAATPIHQVLAATGLLPRVDASADEAADAPFLTVLTRTQGRRRQCLEDVLACLSAQLDPDFEWLVVCHRTDADQLASVLEVVSMAPPRLAARIRVVEVERPGRSSPLNDGFAEARGRYVAVLDDDDMVSPSWVAAFHELEAEHAGRVLRLGSVRQSVVPHQAAEETVALSVGNPRRDWPERFDMLDHLRHNQTPPLSVAFPRGVFHSLGVRFDETLDVTEDWDFLVRAAALVGVTDSSAVAGVYHWWLGGETSRSVHDEAHWDEARKRVLDGFAAMHVLLAGDGAGPVLDKLSGAERRIAELADSQHQVITELDRTARAHQETVDNWRASEARVDELKERLDNTRSRFQRRLDLLEAIEERLRLTGAERPGAPLYELGPDQLEKVLERLPAGTPRRGRSRRRSR